MHYPVYLSPLVIGLSMAVSTSVLAAEPVPLQKIPFSTLRQMIHLTLPNAKPTAAVSTDSLRFISQHVDKNKIAHMRMQQDYAGFPVFGGYAILHSTRSVKSILQAEHDVRMNGMMYRGLSAELGRPSSQFVQQGALALNNFKARYPEQSISDTKVTPMVYIDEQHRAFWAYKVSVLLDADDKIPERQMAIMDAKTHAIFVQWNDIKTARVYAQGMGAGGNQTVGEYQYGNDRPLLEMSRDDFLGRCFMENTHVKVVDMASRYKALNAAMSFSCPVERSPGDNTYWTGYEGDGYDVKNGGYSPSNDALYAGTMIKLMYSNWYDLDVLMTGTKPMQLVMRVHYGKEYENAFWDGQQMTFGDGELATHPLVSLAVGAHEISHGFTEQHANLDYFGQSGGMNESFSDMAAQTAEYYAYGKSSWTIGADILKKDSGYIAWRFMDKPSRDGRSIDTADRYHRGMDVHYSSGVYNRLFYLLANQPGWDPRQAFHVMLKANMDYWTPYTTFNDGACGVIKAAEDLELSVDDVKQSLDNVAVNYQDCD